MPHQSNPIATRICFVRHGETDWNVEKRIQGLADIPLNEKGRAQALAMAFNAAHFSFRAIYSSDLVRAVDTARALAESRRAGDQAAAAIARTQLRHFPGHHRGRG
jgi:Fructose-2,6-bisphosphatase